MRAIRPIIFSFLCIDYIAKKRDNVFRMYSRENLAAKESRKENRMNNIFRVARSRLDRFLGSASNA